MRAAGKIEFDDERDLELNQRPLPSSDRLALNVRLWVIADQLPS